MGIMRLIAISFCCPAPRKDHDWALAKPQSAAQITTVGWPSSSAPGDDQPPALPGRASRHFLLEIDLLYSRLMRSAGGFRAPERPCRHRDGSSLRHRPGHG